MKIATTSFLRIAALGVPFFLAASSVSQARESSVLGFESEEGFAVGTDISAAKSWRIGGEVNATISDEESAHGAQSLKIVASEEEAFVSHAFAAPDTKIVFIDFTIKPPADTSAEPASIIDANSAVIGFVEENGRGRVYAVPAGTDPAVDTGHGFFVDDHGAALEWMRVTFRQDIQANTWDLFIDGRLILIDQPLSAEYRVAKKVAVTLFSSPAGDIYVDDIVVTGTNPLFPDADSDGMPDAFEVGHRLDPVANDRKGDRNWNGVFNIQEYLAGTSPDALEGVRRRVIYVDNVSGSDAASGLSFYAQRPGLAPKRSLRGAMIAAESGDAIVVLPGTGIYFEDSDFPRGTPSKSLEVYFVSDTEIKTEK